MEVSCATELSKRLSMSCKFHGVTLPGYLKNAIDQLHSTEVMLGQVFFCFHLVFVFLFDPFPFRTSSFVLVLIQVYLIKLFNNSLFLRLPLPLT